MLQASMRKSVLRLLFALTFLASGSAFAASYSIGGNVSGLGTGKSVTLLNKGGNALSRTANGAFVFSTKIATGVTYKVTVGTQPSGQKCSVANGSGTVGTANVTSVKVTCVNTYSVGGTLSGLGSGKSVTLLNNGANALTRTSNGWFVFSTKISTGSAYSVTVSKQPSGQLCTVTNGSGTMGTANVTNVAVKCVNAYTIGGSVSGLATGKSVKLLNNGGNALTRSANGAFKFSQRVAPGGSYSVMIGTPPVGQACSITNGSGKNVTANITNVRVTCGTPKYQVTNIGTLGGGTYGRALNEAGQVVGESQRSDGTYRAFRYSGKVLTEVGNLCTDTRYPVTGDSYAYAINESGKVVGRVNCSDPNGYYGDDYFGFLYEGGAARLLPEPWDVDGYFGADAVAINDPGVVAMNNWAYGEPYTQNYLVTPNGAVTPVGRYYGWIEGLNNSGQVVGTGCAELDEDSCRWSGEPPSQAYFYSGGVLTYLSLAGVGSASTGSAINELGEITGSAQIPGGTYDNGYYTADTHAFLYSAGQMSDLGTFGGTTSHGYGINDAGQVVGMSRIAGTNDSRAFIHSTSTGMVDINSLVSRIDSVGTLLRAGRAISNNGMIVVVGSNERTYLLVPVSLLLSQLVAEGGSSPSTDASHIKSSYEVDDQQAACAAINGILAGAPVTARPGLVDRVLTLKEVLGCD